MNQLESLFETLDPKQKAAFLDTRLEWATSGALCQELRDRLDPTPPNSALCQELRDRLCEPAHFENLC